MQNIQNIKSGTVLQNLQTGTFFVLLLAKHEQGQTEFEMVEIEEELIDGTEVVFENFNPEDIVSETYTHQEVHDLLNNGIVKLWLTENPFSVEVKENSLCLA